MESAIKKAEKDDQDKDKAKDPHLEGKSKAFLEIYRTRFLLVKESAKYRERHNAALTIKYCHKYLNVMAQYFGVEEKNLHPRLFTNGDKDIPEIMLISLVYWDMARAFSVSARQDHQRETARLLDQFVNFSVGFKFQYLNSETLRKFIKRKEKRREDVAMFRSAYEKMHIKSKKCYIAGHCLGEDDPLLVPLRSFKDRLMLSKWGRPLVDYYYRWSPRALNYLGRYPRCDAFLQKILRPVICQLAIFLKKKSL